MLLLDTTKPVSLDEIARRIGGFPDSPIARHQAFERAKKELRELGIPIATHQIPGGEQYGYQIDKSEMIIPDLRFTDEEASALAAASALVSFGSGERESALQKLGCVISGQDAVVASIPSQPALFRLFEAIGLARVVRFVYRAKVRTVDVFGISFSWGNWYVVGNERESGSSKTFLLNRIESEVTITDVQSLQRPGDFDISSRLPKNRWEVGEGDSLTATVVVHPDIAPLVQYEIGNRSSVELRDDGSAVVRVKVVDSEPFVDWLLSYFDKAVLIDPPELVAELKQYLNGLAVGLPPAENAALLGFLGPFFKGGSELKIEESSVGDFGVHADDPAFGGNGGLRSASAMYSALIKILPWLARKESTTVEEISRIFSVSGSEVIRLLEIAACCGLPPYTPDSLLEIIVDEDGTVSSYLDLDVITAPRKLSTLEAMVLATTASAALKVPGIDGNGHLTSALKKLQSSLSKFQIGLDEVEVSLEEPFFLKDLTRAVNEHLSIEITYFAVSSEQITRRFVDPYQLFTESGKWYLRGFCHLAVGIRHFSVGRIISCRISDHLFEIPEPEVRRIAQGGIPKAFGGGGERVILAVASEFGWKVERLVETPQLLLAHEGLNVYGLRSSSKAWLSKVLIRLGPSANIVFRPDIWV
ncbi:MAG: WYL domain-containing protein [Acidimicrobiaceae bacterium]|nr:WYL domain-containing protein [Acidimicrobiaceae bacterium]